MRNTDTARASLALAGVCALALVALTLALAPAALAVPFHPREEARDVTGLNHACGAAVDSKGDLYLSSAGTGEVKVYSPAHSLLATVADAHEPCGLAVDTRGELLVSERATGEVVRYIPDAYPLSGSPTYGPREAIDASGQAAGVAVDPFDNRLYVAEGTRASSYGASETQRFIVRNANGGGYKLRFEGQETASLPYNATDAAVREALEALAALGPGDVAVTGSSSSTEWSHSLTFAGARGYADVPPVEVLPSLAPNEIDKLTVAASAGTYRLKFEGQETAPVPFSAPASGAGSLQEALEALPNLAPGDVSVTGGPGDAGGTQPYFIAFQGAYAATNVGTLLTDASGLTGTVSASTQTSGPDVLLLPKSQASGGLGFDEAQLLLVTKAASGTYKLEFEGQETAPIEASASAAEVQAALEALSNLAPGDVAVFPERHPTFQERRYVIVFEGAWAAADVGQLEALGSLEAGAGVAVQTEVAGWSGHVGEGSVGEATGVASYTRPTANFGADRYLALADAAGDSLHLFGGPELRSLKPRREIDGSATPAGSFGFAAAGAYLAADPGNRGAKGECKALGEQACTAGHLFVYDAAHRALDELDAGGEYLDQVKNAAFADAGPAAVVVDRSGTAGDGDLYVTAGAGAGARALAFGPLKQPKRETLKEAPAGLSHVLAGAVAVATDSHGDLYAAAGSQVHVYKPDGGEMLTGGKPLLEDSHKAIDLAVDSACKVYVLDKNNGLEKEAEVTYYTPSSCPPVSGTTYTRHEPEPVAKPSEFPPGVMKAIAVDPGPGSGKDRLFVTSGSATHIYKPAAEGSGLLDANFAEGVSGNRESIAVDGSRDTVYIGTNPSLVWGVTGTHGEETLARIQNTCPPSGNFGFSPYVAVDQADGHVIAFDGKTPTAREYDAAGSCVAEFGNFTEGLLNPYRVAIDSACATHEPPLSEATTPTCHEYDPADGTAYVAFDDTNPAHPPYDVTAFGPLAYSAPAKHKLEVKCPGSGSGSVAPVGCGASAEFEETAVVTLTATADPGSEFTGWTGCEAEPSASECEVTMSKAREVVAEFEAEETPTGPPLTVIIEEGSGAVTGPNGFECTGSALHECTTESIEAGPVALVAEPEIPGNVFKGWGGCETHVGLTCGLTLSPSGNTIKVKFAPTSSLSLTKSGSGSGKAGATGISCDESCSAAESEIPNGKSVTVKTKPAKGSEAAVLSGTGSASSCSGAECTFTITEDSSVSVTFVAKPTKTLTLSLTGPAYNKGKVKGKGIVKGLLSSAFSCGSGCTTATETFFSGDEVELTAAASTGYTFEGWTITGGGAGTCTGKVLVCKVPVDANKTIEAEFK